VPFALQQLHEAYKAYRQFLDSGSPTHHARYVFPFFSGSYFAYRKVDAARVSAIAKSLSPQPSYVDVGCGYGDFLRHIREFIPGATGIEKEGGIFYTFQLEKPDYISMMPVEAISQPFDVAFVGWMEPGQDFRDPVSKVANAIVTTLDQGISLAAEFDGHGFERIASWRTPSWEDVNTEIMNRYYTAMLPEKRAELARLRGAHNLWYVYARPGKAGRVATALKKQVETEGQAGSYEFEQVLDECGYRYLEQLASPLTPEPLWQVHFESQDLKRI
jgi:hypothetical protein